MAKLFIPKKLRVGFVKREGTFDGQLSYVIYYDATGKLRKQDSWEGWRDANIEPVEWDNVPTAGFMLNKGHKRYNFSGFGHDKLVIRIYDPRGAEFEIDPRNLVGLLMHADCSKRQIVDEVVYAWAGKELVLLPCNSEEYQTACNYTKLQSTKVGARNLKPGAIYITRNEEHLMYLGHYMHYEIKNGRRSKEHKAALEERNKRRDWDRNSGWYDVVYHDERVGSKQHMFCDLNGKWRVVKSVSAEIAGVINQYCDDRFSVYLDKFLNHSDHLAVVGYEKRDLPDDFWFLKKRRYCNYHVAFTEYNGDIYMVHISRNSTHTFETYPNMYYVCAIDKLDGSGGNYSIDTQYCYRDIGFDIGLKMPVHSHNAYSYTRHDRREPILNEIDRSKFFDLDYVFDNGVRKPVTDRNFEDG